MKHRGVILLTFRYLGIDHVQLAAPPVCETEARAFYGELLGWSELTKPSILQQRGGVWFRCGEHEVHVGVQLDFVPAKKAHPAFRVQHIIQLKHYLMGHGASVTPDDSRSDEGVERFYLQDPFGNRLEFLEY